jgi:hypothetical protein
MIRIEENGLPMPIFFRMIYGLVFRSPNPGRVS